MEVDSDADLFRGSVQDPMVPPGQIRHIVSSLSGVVFPDVRNELDEYN